MGGELVIGAGLELVKVLAQLYIFHARMAGMTPEEYQKFLVDVDAKYMQPEYRAENLPDVE